MAIMHYWKREPDTQESVQHTVDGLPLDQFYGMLAHNLLFVAQAGSDAFYANGAQTENSMRYRALARRLAREQNIDISQSDAEVEQHVFNHANPGHNVVELPPCPT